MDFQYESNRIFMLDENGILRAEIESKAYGNGRDAGRKKRKKDSSRMLVRRSLVRPSSRI